MVSRKLTLPAVFVAALLYGAAARAQGVDEQSELDKARNAYLAHQYDEADARFRKLLDPQTPVLRDHLLVNQGRMYWGAVLIGKKRVEEAAAQFEEVLLSDPMYEPDPLAFPTNVVNAFIDARARLREQLNAIAREKAQKEASRKAREDVERKREAARMATLERLAGIEKSVEMHSRLTALLPFGVGQFQNGQKGLGWLFLSAEASLAVAAGVTFPIYLVDLSYRSDAYAQGDTFRAQEYLNRAKDVRTLNLSLNAALAIVAVVGIVQAQLAYEPDVAQLTRRPLPPATIPSLLLAPVAPLEGKRESGVVVGVQGTF